MTVSSFRNIKIRTKLIIVSIFLVLLPLLGVSSLSMVQFSNALRNASEEDLEHLVRNIYSMCKVQQDIVGSKEHGILSLKKEIKDIKVGETGYAYVIDSKGNLIIHPAREGSNILDSKDSSGFGYIREMVNRALDLSPEELGTIRYPWINPELGETKPRQKINKFIYFEPWDWIIAAGTYEQEV